MSDFLIVLFLVCLEGFIISFRNPAKVVFWSKNKTRRAGKIGYGIAMIVFFLSSGAAASQATPAVSLPPSSAPHTNQTASTPSKSAGNAVSNKTPTPPPAPVAKPSPPSLQTVAKNAVHSAIPSSNLTKNGDAFLGFMNDNGVLIVQVEAEDNLTHGMIKDGILINAKDIMHSMFADKRVNDVRLVFYYPITDNYGNTQNAVAEKIEFSRQTANQINWDNFLFNDIPNIADDFEVNPAFDSGS